MIEVGMSENKVCNVCGEDKPLSDFYSHKSKKDGKQGKCKECAKRLARENRREKLSYYRQYDRSRANLPHRKAARDEYNYSETGIQVGRECRQRYRKRNPIKIGAHYIVNNAVNRGEIIKPKNCENCGCFRKLQAHHDDYAKPMDVRWLCVKCHRAWHKENGEGANAS